MACRKQGISVNSRDVNNFVGYNLNLLSLTHSKLRGVFKGVNRWTGRVVRERRTDLKGPTSTLEIGKYDKLIFSVML